MKGVLLAAPTSGAGKTTVTLAILRALKRRGIDVAPAKSGPDYIDPKFHTIAAGRDSFNLDAWAMSPDRLRQICPKGDVTIVEGAMGLFDGAGLSGAGSAADLAKSLNLPFILILDCAKVAHSVAAVVRGYCEHDASLKCAGIILNRVGSPRHLSMLRHALDVEGFPPILGHMMRDAALTLPERHLGLVQATETPDLESWLNHSADLAEATVDLDALLAICGNSLSYAKAVKMRPPAQRIAVAQDTAFEFSYPHMLSAWRESGAEISFFSPLADHAVPETDFVFLPGGYPELHAGRLAQAETFLTSLRDHAARKPVYGECGGYMVLGDGIVDAAGQRHEMAGLLRLETSFGQRKLHLGYRNLTPQGGLFAGPLKGHEFHYASTLKAEGPTLFTATDADNEPLGDMGLRLGRVFGSFAHVIDGI